MPFFCFLASFSGARAYLVACFPLPVCLFPIFLLLFPAPGHTWLLAFFFRYAFFLFSGFFSCRQGILFCLLSSSSMPFSCFQTSFLAARAYLVACFPFPVCLFSVFLLLFPAPGHTWLLTFFFRHAFFSIHFSDVFSAIFSH